MSHPSTFQSGNAASAAGSGGDLKHSRELAQQLVRHLGIDGATRACLENHWQGVLEVVRSLSPKH